MTDVAAALAFTHEATRGRVVFGVGSRRSAAVELDRLGATRPLIIASDFENTLAEELTAELAAHGVAVAGRFRDVVQHVPRAHADDVVAAVTDASADSVITIGGGSATGFGKVVRLERDVAFIAVPTTYAGSEMTTIWGRTDGDHKQTGNDPRVKPDTVIYDPELTLGLPATIAGPSGMNALAHCVEAMYGPGANPIIGLHAREGIRALAAGLPRVCSDADGLDARTEVLYGAFLAGVALAGGGTALHHKTCHVLGGMFGLDHGAMNAVVLGHALAYNAPAIPQVMESIGAALGTSGDGAADALFDLTVAIGAPHSLEAIGMPADGIDEAARRVVDEAAANVRRPEEDGIRQMLLDAFYGRRPA
ncbi:MAG: maleylacetate reductase [Actinomycetota bacterium]